MYQCSFCNVTSSDDSCTQCGSDINDDPCVECLECGSEFESVGGESFCFDCLDVLSDRQDRKFFGDDDEDDPDGIGF